MARKAKDEPIPIIVTPISRRSRLQDPADLKPTRLYRVATKVPQSTVNDPYNAPQKQQFEDAANSDNTVKQALLRKAQFTIGRRYKIELQVNDKSLGDNERDALLTDKKWKGYLEQIREIDYRVAMHEKVKAMLIQSATFGRSALHIIFGTQKFQDGSSASNVPVDLHILTSKFLNKVYIDPNTWTFQGVIYTQSFGESKEQNTLKPEELIYFTKNDFHLTPRTLFYGRSDIEPIAHLSEMNRRMDEIDLKEIVTQAWAGMIVLKINSRNASVMNQMADQFMPGKTVVHNQDMEVSSIEIPKDLAGLIALRESIVISILRGLNVPSLIMNFENITNRATADAVLLAWQKSTLEDDRTWLKETLQKQWYDPMLSKLSGIDVNDLPVRVVIKFDTIILSDWTDVAPPALSLWKEQIINREKLLTMLGMEDVIVQLRKEGQNGRLKEYAEKPETEQDKGEAFKKASLEVETKKIEIFDKMLKGSDDVTSKFPVEGRDKYVSKMKDVGYVEDPDYEQ